MDKYRHSSVFIRSKACFHEIKSEILGRGSFGTVFEIERKDFPDMGAALKIISIPSSQNEVKSFSDENYDMDEKSVSSYFYGFVDEIIKEFRIMSQLKGHTNIVSYEDHDIKKHEEGIGWDVFIRMELLTPITQHFANNPPSEKDIIKLGIDICKALEVCQKHQIIHRDIKPSNIFVSKTGDYKLGDFGVARTLEKTSSGLSKKGTFVYMAPEVYKGDEYGASVDIYSLGIVLYRMLNNNLEPFRKDRTYNDAENAMAMRIKGELPVPKPANADGKLAEIVVKACSSNPKERYSSPTQMREELESILNVKPVSSSMTIVENAAENVLSKSERVEDMNNKNEEKTAMKQQLLLKLIPRKKLQKRKKIIPMVKIR